MNLMIVHFAPGDMFLEEINRFVSKEMYYSRLPITRTFKGNRKKGRIIGSSKKIAESNVKNSFYCTVKILIAFNCRNVK